MINDNINVKKTLTGLLERIGLVENTLGVAFSGGGARGFCHVGVMKAFSVFGIRPNVISGVSAGSIAAVLYAAGLTVEEITECFTSQHKFGDFTDFTIPKESFFKLNRFARLLESWLPVKYLEELSLPTVVCATDFDHGKSVGWSKGEIVPRVVASCSIPIIFPPVKINGIHFVDGGVLRNLPAWAIRRYCKTLIGSNCSPLDHHYHYTGSITQLALRSYQLTTKANTLQDLQLCDIIIRPDHVANISTFDLSAIPKAIDLGYEAACRTLDRHFSRVKM